MKHLPQKHVNVLVKIIIVLLLIPITAIGGFKLYRSAQVKNIFDEMYYSWVNRLLTDTHFTNVEMFGGQPDYKQEILMRGEGNGSMFISSAQKQNMMFDGSVNVFVSSLKQTVEYSFIIRNTDNKYEYLDIGFLYDKNKQTLTFTPIVSRLSDDDLTRSDEKNDVLVMIERMELTKKDIDIMKQTLLQECAIREWTQGNGEASKFTSENPGEFTIVDNSYLNLGEAWQDE